MIKTSAPLVHKKLYFQNGHIFVNPLILYSLFLFIWSAGDSLMSYLSPVYIESFVQNSLIMGLIISSSSVIGLICDLIFPKLFSGRSYKFYSWASVGVAVFFPLIYLLFHPSHPTFIAAMAMWGIYYELIHFSNFHFINNFVTKEGYPHAWAVVSAFKSAAYMIGPLLASQILVLGFPGIFSHPLVLFLISGFAFLIFILAYPKPKFEFQHHMEKVSLTHIIKVWKVLWKKIWLLYVFLLVLALVDASFWTIGTLLSEELRAKETIGMFLLPAYSVPALFIGALVSRAAKPGGKKRAAFLAAAISGIFLSLMLVLENAIPIVMTVFIFSLFYSLAFPEISAVFEDFVLRLGQNKDEMIGLQSSAISVAYVIGPVVAGGLSEIIGIRKTFSVFGMLVFIISIACLIIIPRKVRLPQKDLANLHV